MLFIEEAAQRLGLHSDEWQPQGDRTLAVETPHLLQRLAAQAGASAPLGRLVALGSDSRNSRRALRLACDLATALAGDSRACHVATAENSVPGARLQLSPASLQIAEVCNVVARLIDESLLAGNPARLDPRRLTWTRCLADAQMHRPLRFCVTGLGLDAGGVRAGLDALPRQESFETPLESELAAIGLLSTNEENWALRLGSMLAGWRANGVAIRLSEVVPEDVLRSLAPLAALRPLWVEGAAGAVLAGGRFEHGRSLDLPCPGVPALRCALALGDCIAPIDEGLLGLQKFLDFVCPAAELAPGAVVLHVALEDLQPLRPWGMDAVTADVETLRSRTTIMEHFGLPVVIALEAAADEEESCRRVGDELHLFNVQCVPLVQGAQAAGIEALAGAISAALASEAQPAHIVESGHTAHDQLFNITGAVHGASVQLSRAAQNQFERIKNAGAGHLPVILNVQKDATQNITSSNHSIYQPLTLRVTNMEWRAGAGYLQVEGDIET